jgi:hypothetical protein
LVNLCFQQDLIRKLVMRIKTSNRIKLNHDKNYFRKVLEDTRKHHTASDSKRIIGGAG